MYETFIDDINHAALHCFLTVDDPSGRLIRWRWRLAEFDFQVKHKKEDANQRAEDLSRLLTNVETIYHDYYDDFTEFLQTYTLENNSEQTEFLDIAYNSLDMVYATQEVPNINDHVNNPIEPDELVSAQLHDQFCSEIRRIFNGLRCLPSRLTRTAYLFELQRQDRKYL